jgi:formamidopyrimidine-DNA glycosylase
VFEIAEFITLARQMNETLKGKVVRKGVLGNSPHKFVWYNRTHEEFETLTQGKRVGEARARGKWLFIPMEPGYVMVFGECGGKMLFHPAEGKLPEKYHLLLQFEERSFFTFMTQMWGAMELYEQGAEHNRQYIKDMRIPPDEPGFTFPYFEALIDSHVHGEKRSVKGLLTQEQLIPGLGNASAQDILFKSRLHPRHPIDTLGKGERRDLYDAILETVQEMIARGGRNDEVDLYNQQGGYMRLMDKNAVGKSCPECGRKIEKIQYLGGACYFCPDCQK